MNELRATPERTHAMLAFQKGTGVIEWDGII